MNLKSQDAGDFLYEYFMSGKKDAATDKFIALIQYWGWKDRNAQRLGLDPHDPQHEQKFQDAFRAELKKCASPS